MKDFTDFYTNGKYKATTTTISGSDFIEFELTIKVTPSTLKVVECDAPFGLAAAIETFLKKGLKIVHRGGQIGLNFGYNILTDNDVVLYPYSAGFPLTLEKI